MKTYLLLVVLYKRGIKDSETLKTIKNCVDYLKICQLIVWDNSPEPFISLEELDFLKSLFYKITLVHESTNWGLSKVYNAIIGSYVFSVDYIILLDQDTNLTVNYFKAINAATVSNPGMFLFLPKIYCQNKLVSPAMHYFFIGRYFKNLLSGKKKSKNIMAINSGMVIKVDYFTRFSFSYDENLRFYGTDNFFMESYSKNCSELFILDCLLLHSLGHYDKTEDLDSKLKRFKEISYATEYMNKKNKLIFKLVKGYLFFKSIFMSIKHKSLRFIWD